MVSTAGDGFQPFSAVGGKSKINRRNEPGVPNGVTITTGQPDSNYQRTLSAQRPSGYRPCSCMPFRAAITTGLSAA